MNKISIPQFKDTAILCGWIGALLLIGCLCWFLTNTLRADIMRNSVNRVLVLAGDTRRLEGATAAAAIKPSLGRLGAWYNMNEGYRALVFTLIADGVFLPCAAIVDPLGKLEEIIPLSPGGSRLLDRVSPGIIKLYTRRIEGGL
ncbi:MAG: hypothetical protein LBI14_04730 [Treponema sp.]|jgi:hypothetical protein|nr:hypothetical protein [Treponema sp.]